MDLESPRPVIHVAIDRTDFTIDEYVLREVSKVQVEVPTANNPNKRRVQALPRGTG